MEVFYFRRRLTPDLTQQADELGVPDGQPFILDEGEMTLSERCADLAIDYAELLQSLDLRADAERKPTLSYDPDLNEYLRFRSLTSKSPLTWKAESEQLGIFLRWVKAQGKQWPEITLDDLRAFYYARRTQPSTHTQRPISAKTWNACVGALGRFYDWAVENGRLSQAPFTYRQVRYFPVGQVTKNTLAESIPQEPIRFVTLDEYQIFSQALQRHGRNGERNKTFADLLVTTGLRVSEACALTVPLLPDPDAPRYKGLKTVPFRLTGKGGKVRQIRIPKSTLRSVERYRGEDRLNAIARWRQRMATTIDQSMPEPEELWLSERGTAMSGISWDEIFASASRRCGIHCSPHMLRHTFAVYTLSALVEQTICTVSELRDSGRDQYSHLIHNPLRRVQQLLGHSQLETTFIYLDFIEQCEEVVDDAIALWSRDILAEEVANG